ncbi:hypothetical protein EIP86_002178 [Pleurotus ostreatoroseus]|nr:hypothetical protein EIP86_002178 [Pleurotus ostreatoroseus]
MASSAPQDFSSIAPFAYNAPTASAPSPLAPRTNVSPQKRIVPKKSKLGLLASKPKLSTANTGKQKDFSDVVRRVGSSPSKRGFDIYVDHQDDPDFGEIMVVKKQKSRKGLNGMRWDALDEVTNVPSVPKEKKSKENLLKVPKGDENQNTKWWSIGRGRKDVKEKTSTLTLRPKENVQEPMRSKTPEPLKSSTNESRARFNSLDSGILLNNDPPSRPSVGTMGTYSSSTTLLAIPDPGFLSIPPPDSSNSGTGSIAVRAMRSMRSLARMKSWANISGDKDNQGNASNATHSNTNTFTNVTNTTTKTTTTKTKEKEGKKKKEKKSKAKEKTKPSARNSGSSFEVGTPSPQVSPVIARTQSDDTSKKSRLGRGIPSTLRLSAIRNLSSTSLVPSRAPIPVPTATNTINANSNAVPDSARLSVESARLLSMTGRSSTTAESVLSSGSSLRPASTVSAASTFEYRATRSSSSSGGSVRWDEDGLRDTREMQRREKAQRKKDSTNGLGRESRRNTESRRRTAITEIFPEIQSDSRENSPEQARARPIVTVEEATVDGHGAPTDTESMQTPAKRARPRPMSEQLLGKSRPRGISDEADVMLSVSDAAAATNDLANLINWLDLEATPASTASSAFRMSPLQRVPSIASLGGKAGEGSPTKLRGMKYTFNKDTDAPLLNSLTSHDSTASFASLRTYAKAKAEMKARAQEQTNKAAPPTRQQAMAPAQARQLIGQQIVPWSALDWQVSPKKALLPPPKDNVFRPGHRRTSTPAPAADPPVVFQPLRPAAKGRISTVVSTAADTPPVKVKEAMHPSNQTFGSSSKPVKFGVESIDEEDYDEQPPPSPTPKNGFKKGHRHSRAASKVSILSALCDSGTQISVETIKTLGLTGTLGGPEPEIDPEDPDSDIPEELQDILASQSDEEMTQRFDNNASVAGSYPPSPGVPPGTPLPTFDDEDEESEFPVFRVTLLGENDSANEADMDSPASPCGSDTGKSFDFTGELKKLNESGASDRHSFVEQLENAFRTPARVDLGFDLEDRSFLRPDVPPVPLLPPELRSTPREDLVPQNVSEVSECDMSIAVHESETSSNRDSSVSADTLDHLLKECEDFCRPYGSVGNTPVSMRSRESDGRLNTRFKFGGTPSVPELKETKPERPLTLSDIIPPLVARAPQGANQDISFAGNDSSVLESIYAHACEDDTSALNSVMEQATSLPPVPRPRVDSDSSSKRRARNVINPSDPWSHSRRTSEASFMGFESFDEVRRGFEFGPNRPGFYPPPGVSSVSSHGRHESMYSVASVSSYGSVIRPGTLDPFGYAVDRPLSIDEASLSMSLTVDDTFSFLKKDLRRQRVDSDASSFYFRGLGSSRRGHRRDDSSFSATSNAPPISLYNRSYASHRRSDSSGSISSIAQSFANNSRAAWARHRPNLSVDSILSDFSVSRLARPGLGDKMFDSDYGMPLAAITGSPTGSTFDDSEDIISRSELPTSYDSIMDGDPRSSVFDSLFDKTGYRTTHSNVDVFDIDVSHPAQGRHLRSAQFRPVSILSLGSVNDTMTKDDDTMISMLGGGHVRRRSVDIWVEHSPSQGRKATGLQLQHPGRVLDFGSSEDASHHDSEPMVSPEKVIVSKPSIASTSSRHFGGERMIKARHGLLERRSLEDNALMAQGEELLASFNSSRVFTRPAPVSRSRSSTVTSGTETPPLSLSDGSSMSGGSQSSIDLGNLNDLLTASVKPSSGISRARSARIRARGTGHRRRFSSAHASRASVYETIQEEPVILSYSPSPTRKQELSNLLKTAPPPSMNNSVYVVDADTASVSDWDNEHGIVTMRKYYALKDEAHDTVTESQKMWMDTPFSIFAVQSFEPPSNRNGFKALLEHSKQTYGPLPSELRPHRVRSRTSSRASPYPLRSPRSVVSPERVKASMSFGRPFASPRDRSLPLQSISIDPNISMYSIPPAVDIKPFPSFAVELETSKDKSLVDVPRQRVTSSARRNALGWKKRAPKGKGADKENARPEMIIA